MFNLNPSFNLYLTVQRLYIADKLEAEFWISSIEHERTQAVVSKSQKEMR
jgi:hypothetical protein